MIIKIDNTLSLELSNLSHAEDNFELICKNRNYLKQWLTWVDRMQTIDDFKHFISSSILKNKQGTDYGFVIKHNQTIIGRIGIHFIDSQNKTGMLGYWIDADFQGKGIITKVCKTLIQFSFTEINLNRIEIKCATKNLKSKAIPIKLNFTQEGILREAEFLNGNINDLYLYL